MKVFAVFSSFGEGDDYAVFYLEVITASKEGAEKYIQGLMTEHYTKGYSKIRPIHPSMNAENNFTYFGNRKDKDIEGYIGYGSIGGYIVEETLVLE